jgi:hypothetical protein
MYPTHYGWGRQPNAKGQLLQSSISLEKSVPHESESPFRASRHLAQLAPRAFSQPPHQSRLSSQIALASRMEWWGCWMTISVLRRRAISGDGDKWCETRGWIALKSPMPPFSFCKQGLTKVQLVALSA